MGIGDDRNRVACATFLIELVIEIPGEMRAEVSEPDGRVKVSRMSSHVANTEQVSRAADTYFGAQVLSANSLEDACEAHRARTFPKDGDIQSHVGVPGVER